MQTCLSDIASPLRAEPGRFCPAQKESGWRAHLHLSYTSEFEKTVLSGQHHTGPLLVQKPFYPEGPQVCHTYLIHPPGGVVAGDKLGLDVDADTGAHAVITTPAAGKFYRSSGAQAAQVNHLRVAAGATLEWLPQETIVYNQASARMHTLVQLDGNARFIGWEMVCLGLPASDQPFKQGQLVQRFEIFKDGRPLCIEPFEVDGEDGVLNAPWGLAGHPVIGTLMATTGEKDLSQAVRVKTDAVNRTGQFAVTRVGELTLCRYLGGDVYEGLKLFLSAWEVLRPEVAGRAVCVPRIWAT